MSEFSESIYPSSHTDQLRREKKKGSHTLRLFFTLHWRTYSPGSGNPACSLRNHRRNNWWGGWSDWQLVEGHSTFLPTLPGSLTSLHRSKVCWLPHCLHFITTKKDIPAFYRAQVSGKFSSMSILFNTFFFFLMEAVIFKPCNWNLLLSEIFFPK